MDFLQYNALSLPEQHVEDVKDVIAIGEKNGIKLKPSIAPAKENVTRIAEELYNQLMRMVPEIPDGKTKIADEIRGELQRVMMLGRVERKMTTIER